MVETDKTKAKALSIIRKFKRYSHCPVKKDSDGRIVADFSEELNNAKLSSLFMVDSILNLVTDEAIINEYKLIREFIINYKEEKL